MATLGELVVKVNADISGLQKGLDNATGAIQRMNASITRMGTVLTVGVTLPIAALGASVFSAAADMDSLKRALTTIAGSAEGAQQQLARLTEAAKAPGLGFKEAIQGSVRLQAVGINARLAERTLSGLGNAIALTGGGKVELERVTVQLGQMAAKGKLLAQDLRPILESGPAIGQALLKAFGTIDPERIQKLGLTSEQFLTRLAGGLEQLPKVTGGARNSVDNFTDALFRARAAIGEKLLPVMTPLLEKLTAFLTRVETVNPNTVRWGLAIAGVAAVMGPLVLVLSSVTTAVTALASALAVGLLPVIAIGGPILIALAALSAMWAKNKLDALSAAAAADAYRASLIGMSEGQLIAARTAEMLRLQDAKISEDALRRSGRAFGQRFETVLTPSQMRAAQARGATLVAPGLVRVRGETREMEALGNEANDAAARVHSLDAALAALYATAARPTAPLIPPGGGGRDKLAGLMDNLTDRLRELQALQKFTGAVSVNLLPDDAQEQIRLVNHLASELDVMTDGLKRFRDAGRQPPPLLAFGIETINAQLAEAEKRLDTLARLFNDTRMLGKVDVRLPAIQVAPNGVDVRGGATFRAQGTAPVPDLSFVQKLKGSIGDLVAQFGPMGLALAAVNAVLAPLQPLLDALLVPFTIMGEILAALIVPVLRVLFLPLKLLGIQVAFIGEIIARVAGAIAGAIGWLVRGIGKLVNKLPGSPGDPLVRAGQAMIDLGKQFKDAANEMAAKRKELEHMSFDDALNRAADSADRLSESLTNVPPLFDIALRRIQASRGESAASASRGPSSLVSGGYVPMTLRASEAQQAPPVNIVFSDRSIVGGGNAKEVAREVVQMIGTALGVSSDPTHRDIAVAFKMVTV